MSSLIASHQARLIHALCSQSYEFARHDHPLGGTATLASEPGTRILADVSGEAPRLWKTLSQTLSGMLAYQCPLGAVFENHEAWLLRLASHEANKTLQALPT